MFPLLYVSAVRKTSIHPLKNIKKSVPTLMVYILYSQLIVMLLNKKMIFLTEKYFLRASTHRLHSLPLLKKHVNSLYNL